MACGWVGGSHRAPGERAGRAAPVYPQAVGWGRAASLGRMCGREPPQQGHLAWGGELPQSLTWGVCEGRGGSPGDGLGKRGNGPSVVCVEGAPCGPWAVLPSRPLTPGI